MLQVNCSLWKHECLKGTKSHLIFTTQNIPGWANFSTELKVEKKNT